MSDHSLENVIYELIKDGLSLIQCFLNNKMKANPEKFQAKAVGQNITFNHENNVINCEESVKLLGVTLDFQLNFDLHISNILDKISNATVFKFKLFSSDISYQALFSYASV